MNSINISQDENINIELDMRENNTEIVASSIALQPAYEKNNVALLFAASENYMAYFSTMLQSIIEHSSADNNYDIIVFHRNITEESQKIIQEQCEAYVNITVRFYNVSALMEAYQHLRVVAYYSIEIYYRLLAPYILTNYDKILYLDSDMVIQGDVAALFNTELNDVYLLAACKDLEWIAETSCSKRRQQYAKNVLQLQNLNNYFQSGLILFNLKVFRDTFTIEHIMNFHSDVKLEILDQDLLNSLTKDRVLFLNPQWNMPVEWQLKNREKNLIKHLPKEELEKYLLAKESPKIIHYTGRNKVWYDDKSIHADIWWSYAMKTPYAESLQNGMLAYQKEYKKFKNKFKRFIRKLLMPFVNLFFPKGSERREKLREKLF